MMVRNAPSSCISCATVIGQFLPPGGVVFENDHWMVVLRAKPVRFPCLPLLILKRHEEDISLLNPKESAAMGHLIQSTAQALTAAIQPARVHFGIYAEEVKHLHIHVFPRMPDMPPGNIPNLWFDQWINILHRIGLKKAYSNGEVSHYAEKLRAAYLDLL